ncbi:MAG TPA: hypothetical protein DCQ28_05530 [Bacteroidetes bacterium]|nr:hypothetical protein [Bacteroidota bacterium]
MRTSSLTTQKNRFQSGKDLISFRSFLNTVEYKGEHCSSCGHTWSEKGELHYKHCRFFVSSHLHTAKNN